MDRIVVAFANEEAQRRILRLLESSGYRPMGCCFSGAATTRLISKMGSGLVICGFKLRDMTASDLAADLRGAAALLVISSAANLDFCEGENLYKLASPISRTEFLSTLELLQQFEEKHLHHPPPKRREEEQKLIQKAKELLMDINRMSEAEAHRFLQKRSMDAGVKMVETAQMIIDSYIH